MAASAVGAGAEVYTSPDGATWSAAPAPIAAVLHDVAFTGTEFVAVGDNGAVVSSADGVTWSGFFLADQVTLRGVAWDGSDLVVVGGWGYIARSTCSAAGGPMADFTWYPEPVPVSSTFSAGCRPSRSVM